MPRHLCHWHPGLYLALGLCLQKHQAHPPKHKVAVKREEAVSKETTKKLAFDKKIIKKEKEENEVIINEYLDEVLKINCISICPLSGDRPPHELCPQCWAIQCPGG